MQFIAQLDHPNIAVKVLKTNQEQDTSHNPFQPSVDTRGLARNPANILRWRNLQQ